MLFLTSTSSSLVEGFGDEVLVFALTLVLGALIILAWVSTAVPHEQGRHSLVQTILIQAMREEHVDEVGEQRQETQTQEQIGAQVPSSNEATGTEATPFSNDKTPINSTEGQVQRVTEVNNIEVSSNENLSSDSTSATTNNLTSDDTSNEQQNSTLSNENDTSDLVDETAVENLSSSVITNENKDEPSVATSETKETSDKSPEPKEAKEEPSKETERPSTSQSEEDKVTIKLRYLNDSQREVHSSLREQLGQFKRRHFAQDLSENKTVRLIFNGQVLTGEQSPLSRFGLFDQCVVHCLIRQEYVAPEGGEVTTTVNPDDNLDLSHICYPLLGSVLVIIWWCQCVYSHYFSVASTISLVSLTVLFLASIVNTYVYN